MLRLPRGIWVIALIALGACGDDDDDGGTGGGGVQTVQAGNGLTGGGSTETVSLAVDFNAVAARTHGHAFSEITGVPTNATTGANCPAGQKATGINVSTGAVTCAADQVGADTLGALSCTDSQIPKRSGTNWVCGEDATGGGGGGGTVTSVATGNGLLGGPITTSGTIAVDFSAVAPAVHSHPGIFSDVAPGQLRTDNLVGIGNNPTAPLDIYGPDANILVRNTTTGNSPALTLADIDMAMDNINLNFVRGGETTGTIFLAGDDSLAYQTLGGTHRFKIAASGEGSEAMRIDGATGNVGIGTSTPSAKLEVSDGTGPNATCDGNSWINASSRTAKEGIKTFADDDYKTVRRWLAATDVVWYRYKGDRDRRSRVGLIAEDVPSVLATADRKGISTADAIGFLTAAAKELSSENEQLRAENQALLERLDRLERRLDRVERR
jgi:hypothetical protein